MLEWAGIGWNWLKLAGNGQKWLEWLEWLNMAGNGLKWREMAGMTRDC